MKLLSCIRLLATSWTAAYQALPHGVFQARVLEWVAIAFSDYYARGAIIEYHRLNYLKMEIYFSLFYKIFLEI